MSNRVVNYILIGLTGLLFLVLLGHIYLGHYTRWIADDFWSLGISYETGGLGGVLSYWYHNWSFYYSAAYIHAVVGVLYIHTIIPGLIIVLWLAATIWTTYQVVGLLGANNPLFVSIVIGTLLTFVMIDGNINIFQSIYWTVGVLTYPPSVVLFIFLIGFIIFSAQRELSFPRLALVAGGVMLAGGFSALYAFYQAGAALIALAFSRYFIPEPWKYRVTVLVGIALIFSVISFYIALSAPGNAIRQEALGGASTIPDTVTRTVITTLVFFPLSFGIAGPFHFLTLLLVTAFVSYHFAEPHFNWVRRGSRVQLYVVLLTVLLLIVVFFPNSYTSSSSPPPRALVLPHAILTMGVAATGYLIGLGLKKTLRESPLQQYVLFGLSVVAVLFVTVSALGDIALFERPLRTFAQEWDVRDRYIRAAAAEGMRHVKVKPLTYDLATFALLDTVSGNPESGMNKHAANYYDIESIRVEE